MRMHKTIKAGERIKGGINASNTFRQINNQPKKLNSDSENRKYIINLILENIKAGKTEEETLDIAMADERAKAFDYLEKNGLNKRQCFYNWSKSYAMNLKKNNKGLFYR